MKQRITIKIGSQVLAGKNGQVNLSRMKTLVKQISELCKQDIDVILISSGAVLAGHSMLPDISLDDKVSRRQVLSAVGQVALIEKYSQLFAKKKLTIAQVLTTRLDFVPENKQYEITRHRYLNMKNCINSLLECGIIPLINENDTVALSELMFTDNDELSGLVASMCDSQKLILLTVVDGVYTKPPNEGGDLIKRMEQGQKTMASVGKKSRVGRGGMQSKLKVAMKTASNGVDVYIANGLNPHILVDLVEKKNIPYTFFPKGSPTRSAKKWLSHYREYSRGGVVITTKALERLLDDTSASLLPIGIEKITMPFDKDDIIQIESSNGKLIGWGRSRYSSSELKKVMGKKNQKPLIHYDYLHIED